jgi:hypothetical protein
MSSQEKTVEKTVEKTFISTKDILFITFVIICFANLVSRSIMKSVGENDNGRECPGVSGPAMACTLYGASFLFLLGLTVKAKVFDKNPKITGLHTGILILLIILNMGIFIAYIPYTIKAKDRKDTDTECLTSDNKNAIEYMEIILNGALAGFSLVVIFTHYFS